ncbi:MAG: DegV family protein [Chloroflexota bacterium]|nr:DegV family protein [Chloroflexota bacterium]
MTVRIVTDSTCDLPSSVLESLRISMVPVDVIRDGRPYKDGVDISHDELYQLLGQSEEVPTTAAPPPARFAETYERLAEETDGIVSLHLTSEHSAVCDVARRARENLGRPCTIQVMDSRSISMGLGMLVMDAAEAANRGASLKEVVQLVEREIPMIRAHAAFDTMRYLALGGRVNKVVGSVGAVLSIRLLLTIRDGRLRPAGIARTYPRAIDRLLLLTEQLGRIAEWSVVYSTDRGQAEEVAERMARICPRGRVPITRLGPALGVHAGPGVIAVVAKVQAS